MIIYGSRMYGKKNVVHTQGYCQNCDKMVKQKSYDGRKFGHLYFIPLFPCEKAARVIQECGSCGMGSHVPAAEVPDICDGLAAELGVCVDAATRGEHYFVGGDGMRSDNGPFLASAIEMLTVLDDAGTVQSAVSRLDGASYEGLVASAVQAELAGDLSQASKCMQGAARTNPDDAWPILSLADYAGRTGKHADQVALLDRAIDLAGAGERTGLKMQKLGPLECLKEFGQLFELMGECMKEVPDLARDKKFIKERARVEKKARKLGQI